MISSSVAASPLFRFAANAMPTWENRRSTAADDRGTTQILPCHHGQIREFLRMLHPPVSGMSLFGIFAHGITESWIMEKALIGLVACESERHTAENIATWTKDALKVIGLTADGLMGCN